MELHANTGRPAVPVAAVAVCLTKSSGYRTSAANLCANRAARRWREGHDLCTAVDVPLTAPSTAGAGAASNASSENPASRSWRSVQPQKPNINAQSAQNMSALWQECHRQHSDISDWVAARKLMHQCTTVQSSLVKRVVLTLEGVLNRANTAAACQRHLAHEHILALG